MTRRQPADPAPGPLEGYSARFDDLFETLAGRQAFRRYLEGLLLPTERNKTLTALANTEPLVGAQRKEAQGLQWFLSESSWSPEEINRRRVQIMLEDPRTAPTAGGALVVDETPGTARTGQSHGARRQAVPGRHRQDRRRGALRFEPVGRGASVLSA